MVAPARSLNRGKVGDSQLRTQKNNDKLQGIAYTQDIGKPPMGKPLFGVLVMLPGGGQGSCTKNIYIRLGIHRDHL